MSESKPIDVERLITNFQDGAMTYFHLFDRVTRNDRFHIGNLLFDICIVLENQLADNEEAIALIDDIQDNLCNLDCCDPDKIPGDCEQQDFFKEIFDDVARLKVMLDIEE